MLSKSGRKCVETGPGKHVLKLVYFNTSILASIEDTAKAPMFEVQSAPQGLVSSFENYSFKYPRKAIVSYNYFHIDRLLRVLLEVCDFT